MSKQEAITAESAADAAPDLSVNGAVAERAWYVAYTQPRQESVALLNLKQQGFDAYLPLYKVFKKSSGKTTPVLEPMFPRYVFFRPGHEKQSMTGARSTRGVAFVLSFGLNLAVLKPEQFKAIQAFEAARNSADLGEISGFQPGTQVRLRGTALNGLEGMVKSVSAKRVTLLLEMLGKQQTIHVEHGQIERA